MSTLTLLITLLGSLLKSQRLLALENLALRQQVTMLRQSVKRLRATAADKLFCSKRDVNKRNETTKHPDALDHPSPVICPKAVQGTIGVEYVRFVEYDWSFYPPWTPYLFSRSTTYLPGDFFGVP